MSNEHGMKQSTIKYDFESNSTDFPRAEAIEFEPPRPGLLWISCWRRPSGCRSGFIRFNAALPDSKCSLAFSKTRTVVHLREERQRAG